MNARRSNAARVLGFYAAVFAAGGCSAGPTSPAASGVPPTAATVRARFAEGAPSLKALINGVPTDIGAAYLQVDGQTMASSFDYGTMTSFLMITPGTHSLVALDTQGYRVGPIKTSALSAGKQYSLVLVGAYPKYSVLTFEEPANASNAQLSLYEASPTVPNAGFGRFRASTHSKFQELGSAKLGEVKTVSLGKSVSDFGGYVGQGNKAFKGGTVTPAQVDGFDTRNALPFNAATRLSLFLFDSKSGTTRGPVFGSLDR